MREIECVAADSRPGHRLLARIMRRRDPAATALAVDAPTPTKWILAASRLMFVFAILAVAGMFASAAVGYQWARQYDDRLASNQRNALREIISTFPSPVLGIDRVETRVIELAQQAAGLKNLKFETTPAVVDRESFPLFDANGRIGGFLSWDAPHPMAQMMGRLASIFAALGTVLSGFAALSLWQLMRARRELARRDAQIIRAADEDKLTGLPNHSKILELLDLALAERADGEWTTFALIEIDGMDDVAAQHGVMGGDELIAVVARRLEESLPELAVCGRISGDRFALIVTAGLYTDVETSIRAALEAVARPYWVDTVVRLSAHAGFAQAPRHATTRGELTRRADLALRAAARRGPGTIVAYDLSIDTISMDQKFIRRELPPAIGANELELHFQPIVSSQGGRMVGVEALLRWNHPARGSIPPATFIPVAEQMGLMDTIGAFVLRRALQEAKRWPDELYVAVNLSPLQVRDRTIVDLVRSELTDSGVTPSRVILEITEGVLIDNPDEMITRIKDLQKLGVRVALDDFGSGYSNLGYLQRFPLDKLKIDKSFVAALGRSANGGVIIQAIVALGRALGLSVLVEGVETEHQRVLLRLAGCDEMQGFLFAKPAPAAVIDQLIARAQENAKFARASGEALTA